MERYRETGVEDGEKRDQKDEVGMTEGRKGTLYHHHTVGVPET